MIQSMCMVKGSCKHRSVTERHVRCLTAVPTLPFSTELALHRVYSLPRQTRYVLGITGRPTHCAEYVAAECALVSGGRHPAQFAMPKRGADKGAVKASSEAERAISVLGLPERQLDLDTEESGSEGDSEEGFSSDEADEGAAALEDLDADDDEEDGSADEVRKSVLALVQGQQAAGEDAPQDRRDRTAEAGTSGAQSDSDSSEDERPSRNTGQAAHHIRLYHRAPAETSWGGVLIAIPLQLSTQLPCNSITA